MTISYRPCREKDLIPSFKMVRSSMNHLRKNTGKAPLRYRVRRYPEVTHLYNQDKKRFWCAWDGKNIIGFTAALLRGKQWYLAFLFVHPRYQDKGVGKELLKRVWIDAPGLTHSLSTFAYNVQAVGIYSKFGMAPICAMPVMEIKFDKLKLPVPSGLKASTTITRQDIAWINQLEAKIRGYSRPQEWGFWSKQDEIQICLFKNKGQRVGYSMIHNKWGVIAPAGAVTNDYLTQIVADSIGLVNTKEKSIRLYCPANNINLYRFLIGMGFRILEMDLFLSDKPYADFQRYLPAQLAIF
jgi:GNAT superfamily N-acetyltransferase